MGESPRIETRSTTWQDEGCDPPQRQRLKKPCPNRTDRSLNRSGHCHVYAVLQQLSHQNRPLLLNATRAPKKALKRPTEQQKTHRPKSQSLVPYWVPAFKGIAALQPASESHRPKSQSPKTRRATHNCVVKLCSAPPGATGKRLALLATERTDRSLNHP